MRARTALALMAIMLLGAMPAYAHGHGGHGHVSFWIGPVWGPGWWGPGYYYPQPPQTVVIERAPQVYVQPGPQTESSGYWYYCRDAKAYYPYVKDCPGGWSRVSPTPHTEEGR